MKTRRLDDTLGRTRPIPSDEDLLARPRKIEGQVRGLQHTIERGDRCMDVLTQVAAARAALATVGVGVVDLPIHATAGLSDSDEVLAAVERLIHL